MTSFYISTPIYYVNGTPHIGHAYTTIVADAFARYYRQAGSDVFFMTGTDEHGLKVQRAAEALGVTAQELADKNSDVFRDLFEKLEISHDRFIRTTEEQHKRVVTRLVEAMLAKGDIYLAKYAGWYSASDEAYYDATEVQDGKALASGSAVEWVEESSYFFRLSKYQEPLLAWCRGNPLSIQPEGRKNEVISFVEGGLKDLSISRTTFRWGIPMPKDPEHVLYVWLDALTNYITGVGAFEDEALFQKFWPCDIHLLGKDILRFHAVYWPAFLMSAGLPLPKQVLAHGWWLHNRLKMSKSLNNVIDPYALLKTYDLDVIRYYLLREIPLGNDGTFEEKRIIERNNGELADNLGNLISRTWKMVERFAANQVPAANETIHEADQALRKAALDVTFEIHKCIEDRQIHSALERLMELSNHLNQYVHKMEPWKLSKDGQTQRLKDVLRHALEGIRYLTILAAPFLPRASKKLATALSLTASDLTFASLSSFFVLPEGRTLQPIEILFPKFELPEEDAPKAPVKGKKPPKDQTMTETKAPEAQASAAAPAPSPATAPAAATTAPAQTATPAAPTASPDAPALVDFNAFMALELRAIKIVSAERVQGSEKLLKLSIDAGEAQPRTVVAGIAKSFAPEEITGLTVAAVTNLKPTKIFGIQSQAMLLAADRGDGKVELTRYSDAVKPGTRIK